MTGGCRLLRPRLPESNRRLGAVRESPGWQVPRRREWHPHEPHDQLMLPSVHGWAPRLRLPGESAWRVSDDHCHLELKRRRESHLQRGWRLLRGGPVRAHGPDRRWLRPAWRQRRPPDAWLARWLSPIDRAVSRHVVEPPDKQTTHRCRSAC